MCHNLSVFNKNCKQVSLTFNYWFSDNTEQICPPDKTAAARKTDTKRPTTANATCQCWLIQLWAERKGEEGEEGWRKEEIHGGSEFHMLPFTKDEQQESWLYDIPTMFVSGKGVQ